MSRSAICMDCQGPFEADSNTGMLPKRCPECKVNRKQSETPSAKGLRGKGRRKGKEPVVVATPEAEERNDILDFIDAHALDYNLGSAVHFIVDRDAESPRGDLERAKEYLERAIARCAA